MKNPLFALIDCNNFFASCEQVFRPGLANKPLVVLSSNDGCVVARSQQAREIGIPMGAPAFKYKEIFRQYGVLQFSANFELYGDMSRRITEILTSVTPRMEVYSIDESFLDISQLEISSPTEWAHQLRQTLFNWVGIQVSIGIAPSKTLAKLASERAKKDSSLKGVLDLSSNHNRKNHLAISQVEDIWGIGWRFAPRLRALGIGTAKDVATLTPLQGRRLLGSVHGEKLVRELNGQSCYPLERTHVDQKMISVSRTFGQDTNQKHEVEAALASFAARTSQKLRVSSRQTNKLAIFLNTSRHKPPYRKWYREVILDQPTSDTGKLISLATKLFDEIYDKSVQYHRAGVILSNFSAKNHLQTDLLGFRDVKRFNQSNELMGAIDKLQARYGHQTTFYATERIGDKWRPRKNISSPRYTTCWEELPIVNAKH